MLLLFCQNSDYFPVYAAALQHAHTTWHAFWCICRACLCCCHDSTKAGLQEAGLPFPVQRLHHMQQVMSLFVLDHQQVIEKAQKLQLR